MRLRTLGRLALDGACLTRPKPLLLLAYLALEGRRGRRFLAELFWPGAPDPRNNLATALAQLRAGAPGAVHADREHAWTPLACDALELIEAAERGACARALALYRGPFLDGAAPARLGVELEEWIHGTREHLAGHLRRCRLLLAREAAARGAFRTAASHAERAFTLTAAPPPDVRLLEALHALLAAADHPRAAAVRDEARSCGLELDPAPEAARSALRAAGTFGCEPPPAATSFVGRRRELAELTRLLEAPESRLLTLVGTAGVGKTRLALQLVRTAAVRRRHPDGVVFVPLETLRDPQALPGRIAAALGGVAGDGEEALERAARLVGDRRALLLLDNFEQLIPGAAVVAELLRACSRLVLLVTSRERLGVAGERVYPLTGLAGCGGERDDAVRLFVQRAQSADLRFGLTPEALPAVERICRAVEGLPLALELAAAWIRVLPVAEIAGEIESNLDLNIAPAAAPERHRSLRAAFAHSWELLDAEAQRILRRLSVFRGGFTRDAAREVAGASLARLGELVDKSLLRLEPNGRFGRHPLLHRFCRDKLAADEAERRAVGRRHARWFLDFAEAAAPRLTGPEAAAWLDRLAGEHDNLRAALDWSEAEREVELGLRLATATLRFWLVRGHLQEGRDRLDALLALLAESDAEVAKPVRAAALDALATLQPQQAAARALLLLRESLALWRELGDERRCAVSLDREAWVLANLAEFPAAKGASGAALALHRAHCDLRGEAVSRNNLGFMALWRGYARRAQREFRASLRLRRLLASPREIAYGAANLAWAEILLGHEGAAAALLAEAAAGGRRLGDDALLGYAHCLRGVRARRRGRPASAVRALEAGLCLLRDAGSSMGSVRFLGELAAALWERGERARARRCLDEHQAACVAGGARIFLARSLLLQARFEGDDDPPGAWTRSVEALRALHAYGDGLGTAEGLEAIAELYAQGGDALPAVRLQAAAAALRGALGTPRPEGGRAEADARLARVRTALGAAYGAAWREGSGWSPGVAVDRALSSRPYAPTPPRRAPSA